LRSELVFSAQRKIINRFLLCRLTSISIPRMHRASTPVSHTVNQILTHLGVANPVTADEATAMRPPAKS